MNDSNVLQKLQYKLHSTHLTLRVPAAPRGTCPIEETPRRPSPKTQRSSPLPTQLDTCSVFIYLQLGSFCLHSPQRLRCKRESEGTALLWDFHSWTVRAVEGGVVARLAHSALSRSPIGRVRSTPFAFKSSLPRLPPSPIASSELFGVSDEFSFLRVVSLPF